MSRADYSSKKYTTRDAKKIAKELVVRFRELDAQGVLAEDGRKVGRAINRLREELGGLTYEERTRRVTI